MTATSSIDGRAAPPGLAGRRAGLLRSAWPLLLLLAISLPAVTTRIYASDEVQYFVFLRSAWFDHDLSFDNDYRYFYEHGTAASEGFYQTHLEMTTDTGHRLNYGTIGSALLWAPFYGVADVLVRAGVLSGPADGYSHAYVAAVCYGSAFYACAALLVSMAVARRLLEETGRLSAAGASARTTWLPAVAAIAVFMGTPLLFYSCVAPVFAHACSAFAVALFVYTWLRVRHRWSAAGMIALGSSAALLAMVREQDVFFIIGPAIDFAIDLGRGGFAPAGAASARVPRLMAHAGLGCLAYAIVWMPQGLAYLALNGRLGPSHLVSRKMAWTSPHALQVVFSPEHGLFFWTPLAVICLAGLLLAAFRARGSDVRRVLWCALAMVVAEIYVSGAVESWRVAGAFGQRRFVGLTVLLVVGLAALLARARSGASRLVVAAVVAVSIWWNVALMVQFATGLMDRQRLNVPANAYNTFVVVPGQLPRIVYRYLFDRKSFYAPAHGARAQ